MPRVVVCNIGHEAALGAGEPTHYTPPRIVQEMRRALWSLPLWTDEESLVHPFSESVSTYLTPAQQQRIAHPRQSPSTEPIQWTLWGAERSLIPQLCRTYGQPTPSRELLEQYTLAKPLHSALTRTMSERFFATYAPPCCSALQGIRMIRSLDEVSEALAASPRGLLLKLPYSSSGRGILPINHLSPQTCHTLTALFAHHGSLLMEPHLLRLADFGAEYWIEAGKVQLIGLCAFATNNQGQYLGSYCADPAATRSALEETLQDATILAAVLTAQQQCLEREVAPYYRGFAGVDLLTYQDPAGNTQLHPWVEVNLRYTMGHYSLDLYHRRIRGLTGNYRFGICPRTQYQDYETRYPQPRLAPSGRLLEGLLPLTSPLAAHVGYLLRLD